MEESRTFREVVTDFKQQEMSLKKEARAFAQLQHEIAALRERADCDPEARKKLARLDEFMSSGGRQLEARIGEQAKKIQRIFIGVADQFAEMIPSGGADRSDGDASPKRVAAKKAVRKFA
ncbi:hypothetical protein WKR88_27110 [Trinickia caryophylli]|uniref:Uncharacterized protein n=1 Tax=Trinickia caryophylli TaxID=28094 RepID=A0A1X7EWN1_TRICW|nr:hypothetical protein [Trinickia caryophylli]PMS09682.1 hypothetical protein C0Z17_23680 [Trinickia caryophylli]TRX18452.1 hypothetical protein FNF07_09640 [Trinickia caryophylli]WQE10763.1 hypothetical protein U0034_13290 [Trinickia caryophylli]SMF41690.1 hypothetical protein SAMN06295900_106395 [Trinickia caryophylli]GLU33138.1 hypothetical protein Busp01_29800 [Trinickia caryophylli]